MATPRPYIVVNDVADATNVAKSLVGSLITYAYEFKGTLGGKQQHHFLFINLGDAHEALDEIAALNINVVLHEK